MADPPDEKDESIDVEFGDEDDTEIITRPDHPRASVICPKCGAGQLRPGKVCGLCFGKAVIDRKTYDTWKSKFRRIVD